MDVETLITNAEKAVAAFNACLTDPANKFSKDQITKLTPITSNFLIAISRMAQGVSTKTASLEGELRAYKEIGINIPVPQNNLDICEAISEINERSERAKNIIICNIPESIETTAANKLIDDKNKVSVLISALEDTASQDMLRVYRIGKPRDEKPRSLKVEFNNPTTSRTLLSKRHLLKNNTRMYPDATLFQQNHLKNLREELEKRKTNGENDITIKYVNGNPKIVQIPPKNDLNSRYSTRTRGDYAQN